MKRLNLAAIAVAGTLALALSGCSTHYTDPSMISLRYSGGIDEGGEFKECAKPGEKVVSDDSYYPYPTSQRQDLFDSGNEAADHKDLELTSSDGVLVYMRVNVNFGLNVDCDTLRKFHETIGRTRKAYFNDDGTYPQEWITVMDYYVTPAVVARARDVVSKYKVNELWPSTAHLTDIQAAMQGDPEAGGSLQAAVNNLTEGDEQFYNRLTVNVYAIEPEDGYQSQFLERQQAQTAAETAELNKTAQVAQAEADGAVKTAQARAAADAKREEILAYKLPGMTIQQAIRAYNEAQAIAAGMNPYQPNGTLLSSGN